MRDTIVGSWMVRVLDNSSHMSSSQVLRSLLTCFIDQFSSFSMQTNRHHTRTCLMPLEIPATSTIINMVNIHHARFL